MGGSTIAGKTSYFNSFFYKNFYANTISTIGNKNRLIKKLNKTYFNLWDSARWCGRFDHIIRILLKKIDGVILMFDLSDKKDFDNLPHLLDMITEFYKLENFPVLLIGNKSDLDIKVNENEIKKFLDKEKFIGYFEVSCKTHKNVEESVDYMVNYIYKKEKKKFI